MLGFKNNYNVYTIQIFYPTNFLTTASTSHAIRLPELTFNQTIIPKANQSNPNTPNRVSWLYNTFPPQVNPLRSSSSTPDTNSSLQMILPMMDTNDVIVSGPFSDNYVSDRSMYRSTSEELLHFRMQ